MYKIEIDQSTSKATLQLSGSMTITNAQEIKDALFSALSGTNNLVLDYAAVQEYDLSFMQLLISLYRTANVSGKKLSLVWNDSPLFKSLLNDCGCPDYSWLVQASANSTLEEK